MWATLTEEEEEEEVGVRAGGDGSGECRSIGGKHADPAEFNKECQQKDSMVCQETNRLWRAARLFQPGCAALLSAPSTASTPLQPASRE